MDTSIVLALHIAADTNTPMLSLATARLVPNKGIEGDRYYHGVGSFSTGNAPVYDVTLIEEDMLQALEQEALRTGNIMALRRNIVVSGCSLAMLIERPFQIGTVQLRGLVPRRLGHLTPEQLFRMRLRTGIGAQILTEGIIHLGDEVFEVKSLATVK